ncbi:MAG: UDP-N-acetylmuramoyl-L-alanyl-D-glutamate--2,6-diaminopimelate ligase [Bifidobacterium sp.]|nr:UDP-N-acetylmuramoyl-L-alanyl-D-glutamate--2,6-diaminopimelate ligase [Bifidobacterium sp.]
MTLTLRSACDTLEEAGLLHEVATPDGWTLDAGALEGADTPFTAITYDSRAVVPGALMVCKGNFKAEYLKDAAARGMAAYVAERDYPEVTGVPGLVVDNATKALSLLAQEFYGHPERRLTLIGITGTKGKTTTAYLTHAILAAVSGNKAALFSSVDNCVDGVHYVESDLTTPESLDAVRMMAEAVEHGMEYLVMEVSSQAYKVNRVYGLEFDAAAFLNISPDHISPIEHPTFEDYLWCKRQLVRHTKRLTLGVPGPYAPLIEQDAARRDVPVDTFSLEDEQATVFARPVDASHSAFDMLLRGKSIGELSLAMDGDFNIANAAAALALADSVGVDVADPRALDAMRGVRISGRMEQTRDAHSDTIAIVDYAHNYASVKALLDYVDQRYGERHPRITLVTGSAGGKAIDRRHEIVEAAQGRIDQFIFTQEDTNTEPYEAICQQMFDFVTAPDVRRAIVLDRTEAIERAVDMARDSGRFNVVLVIGKGEERWIKDRNKHVPYEGDDAVVARLFK